MQLGMNNKLAHLFTEIAWGMIISHSSMVLKNIVGSRIWKLCLVYTPFFLVHDNYSVYRSCSPRIFDAEDLGRLGVSTGSPPPPLFR